MENTKTISTLSILSAAPATLLDANKMDHDFDFFKIQIHFPNGKYGYNNVNRLCLSVADKILSMAINPDSIVQHYVMAYKNTLTTETLKNQMLQQMGSKQIELKIQKFSYREFSQAPSDQVILARLLLNSLPKRVNNAFGYHSSCTNEELWTIPPAKTKDFVDMFVIRFDKQSEFTNNPVLRLSFTEYKRVKDPTDSKECGDNTLYHYNYDEFVPVYDKKNLISNDQVFIHKARFRNAKPKHMSKWPYLSQGPKSSKILSSRDTMYHQTMDLLNEAYSNYLLAGKHFTFVRRSVTNLPALHKVKKKSQEETAFIKMRLTEQWSEIDSTLWPCKIQIYAGNADYLPAAQKAAKCLEQISPLDTPITIIDNSEALDFSQPIIQIVKEAPKQISINSDRKDDYLELNSEKVNHVTIKELRKNKSIHYLRGVMTDLFLSWCMQKQVIPFAKSFLPDSLDNVWIVKEAYVPAPNEDEDGKTRKVRLLIIFKVAKEENALRGKFFTKVYPKNNYGDPFFGEMDQIKPNDPDLPVLSKVLQQYMAFASNKKNHLLEAYICNTEQGLEAAIWNPGINVLSNEEYYHYEKRVIGFTLTQEQLEDFANKFDISVRQLFQQIQSRKELLTSFQQRKWTYDAFNSLFFDSKLLKRNKKIDHVFEEMFSRPLRLSRNKECLGLIGGLRNLSYWRPTPLSIAYSVGSNNVGQNGTSDETTLAKGTRVRIVELYTDNQVSIDFIENYTNILENQLNCQLRFNLAGATSAPSLMIDHFAKQQAWRARKLRLTY